MDRFTGDWQFTCPVVDFANRYAETGNIVHMYYFSQRASVSPWPTWSGALHGDEVPFVFGIPLNPSKDYKEDEVRLSKEMMAYWANFAKTGCVLLSLFVILPVENQKFGFVVFLWYFTFKRCSVFIKKE